MSQSETSNHLQIFKTETAWAEVPAGGAWKTARITGESLEEAKEVVVSNEITANAEKTAAKDVGRTVTGDINFELTFATWNEWFEAMMRKTGVTINYAGIMTISAAAADNSINDSANAFPGTIVPGMWIRIVGFTGTAGNNGVAKVVTATVSKIVIQAATLGGITLVNDAAGEAVTITAFMVRNGVTKKSLVWERQYLDIAQYMYFHGLRVDKGSFEVTSKSIVTGSWGCYGKKGLSSGASVVGGGSIAAANTNEPMTAAANVSAILEGGAVITVAAKDAKINVANNLRYKDQIGSKYAADVGYGTFEVTASFTLYFEDLVMYQKFENHTASSLTLKLIDDGGNVIVFTLPKLFYTKASAPAAGENQDIMLPMEIRAVRDPTTGCTLQVDSI